MLVRVGFISIVIAAAVYSAVVAYYAIDTLPLGLDLMDQTVRTCLKVADIGGAIAIVIYLLRAALR